MVTIRFNADAFVLTLRLHSATEAGDVVVDMAIHDEARGPRVWRGIVGPLDHKPSLVAVVEAFKLAVNAIASGAFRPVDPWAAIAQEPGNA